MLGVGVWGRERNNTSRGQLSVSVGERANTGPWGLNGDGEGGLGAGGEEASPEGARYAWSGEGRGGGDSGTGSLRPFKTHTVRTRGGGRRSRTGLKTTRRQVAPSSRAPRSACALFSLGRGWCSTTSPPNREPHRLPAAATIAKNAPSLKSLLMFRFGLDRGISSTQQYTFWRASSSSEDIVPCCACAGRQQVPKEQASKPWAVLNIV